MEVLQSAKTSALINYEGQKSRMTYGLGMNIVILNTRRKHQS